jgi:hypothetical protein
MPDVEKVEEELLVRNGFFSFLKKFRTLPRSRTGPERKEMFIITLKEISPARQELTAVLN